MRLDIPLKQEIVESLPGLLDDVDLHVVEDVYMPESFGNSYVTLQSSWLWVRFVRDRGHVHAEVAPPTAPTSWWPLGLVLIAIHRQVPEDQSGVLNAARLLRDNFRELADALGPRLTETRSNIERVRAEQGKALADRGR